MCIRDRSNNGNTLVSTVCENYVQDFIEINKDEFLKHDIDLNDFNEMIKTDFLVEIDFHNMIEDNIFNEDKLKGHLKTLLAEKIKYNVKNISTNECDELIKNISLAVVDEEYRNHLNSMDYLRQSIGLRGYAQKNPKNEYKRESFEMFNVMLTDITKEILKICCRIKIENYNTSSTTKTVHKESIKKSDNPECLLNTSNGDVPRNKRCPVTNVKFKQCCGKL